MKMQTKVEHLKAAEKLDSYASNLNDGPYKAKVLGFAEKHRRQSTRKGGLFGKALGLFIALVLSLGGLAFAGIAIGETDPIGWAVIAFGLGIFGIGASLTLMWVESRRIEYANV